MKEPYGEGLASHTGSESCAWHSRKAAREALTGAQAGRVLSREMDENQSADAVGTSGRQHWWMRECEHPSDSARSKTPCMLGNFTHENRETRLPSVAARRRIGGRRR